MKKVKSGIADFFDFYRESSITERFDSTLEQYLDILSALTSESIYVLDVQQGQLCYVSPGASFLCDHTVEEALSLGYNLFQKIIHPEDLLQWQRMHKSILFFLKNFEGCHNEIGYFTCTLRMFQKYSFRTRPLSQMVFKRIKPAWKDCNLRYLFCSVASSTAKEAGNLRINYKNRSTYKEYSLTTRIWKEKAKMQLTERERATLMLAQQGKNTLDIAGELFRGHHTIRNQIKPLLSKLEVNSIFEAITIAGKYRLMYVPKQVEAESAQPVVEAPRKRTRKLLTDDMFQRIQEQLDAGLSIRKAATMLGISESAIRYWKNKGKIIIEKIK